MDNYNFAFPITKITAANSSNKFSRTTNAIYVGTTGDVTAGVYGPNRQANTVTFKSLQAGIVYPIKTTYILTSSTANNIVGLI